MNTVVYYPHLYPTPEWLKVAVLCWDKIYRIVPPGNYLSDPEIIQELDYTFGGVLEEVDIWSLVQDPAITEPFKRWIKAREKRLEKEDMSTPEEEFYTLFPSGKFTNTIIEYLHERGLIREDTHPYDVQVPKWEFPSEWGLSQAEVDEFIKERLFRSGLEAPDFGPDLPPAKPGSDRDKYERLIAKAERLRDKIWEKEFYLKHPRISEDLETLASEADILENEAQNILQKNLVTVTQESSAVYLPKDIGLYYLSLCAAKAAQDGNRDLVADGEKFTDVVFNDVRNVRGEVGMSVLQGYLPKDISTLEPKRIAEFRSELAVERLKYQKAIQSIVDDFSGVASEEQLGKLKERLVEIAKERVEKTKITYQRANLDMAIKTFSLALTPPAIATSIASLLGIGIFAPAGIAAALSIFVANRLLEWDKATTERNESPWSYILDSTKL